LEGLNQSKERETTTPTHPSNNKPSAENPWKPTLFAIPALLLSSSEYSLQNETMESQAYSGRHEQINNDQQKTKEQAIRLQSKQVLSVILVLFALLR